MAKSIVPPEPILRPAQGRLVVPSVLPPLAAGDRAVDVSCNSAAELTAHPRVLADGRYIPLDGTDADDGTNVAPVTVPDAVTAAAVVAPVIASVPPIAVFPVAAAMVTFDDPTVTSPDVVTAAAVVVPVTDRVPPMAVLPVAAAIVTLDDPTVRSPEVVRAATVVAPVTPSVPPTTVLPDAAATVNLDVATEKFPAASTVPVKLAAATPNANAPLECVTVALPAAKSITPPDAKNRSAHGKALVPSALPSLTAGDSAEAVNWTSAAELTAKPKVLVAGRYRPFVGADALVGMNVAPVTAPLAVTAAAVVAPVTANAPPTSVLPPPGCTDSVFAAVHTWSSVKGAASMPARTPSSSDNPAASVAQRTDLTFAGMMLEFSILIQIEVPDDRNG